MEKNVDCIDSSSPNAVRLVFAIPARLSSTRLSEKPLRNLGGLPMIARVAERALTLAHSLHKLNPNMMDPIVLVATDNEQIAAVSRSAGVTAIITPPELKSGTDRIHAALKNMNLKDHDLVVNIQGDEPFFSIEDITKLVNTMLKEPNVPMGTLAFQRNSSDFFLKSSVVKVIVNQHNHAIYFTRAPAPWPRAALGASGLEWVSALKSISEIPPFLHHLGVYAFRWSALQQFAQHLPPSTLETTEGLEQLRAVEAGWKIIVEKASEAPFGIDTPEDLAAAEQLFKRISEISR